MNVTKTVAAAVLPILCSHAARLLDGAPGGDPRRAALATDLRAGKAGGNAVESLNQNTDDAGHNTLPAELDSLWRVLCAFERIALDGELRRGGAVDLLRGAAEQPHPWMLNQAADAIAAEAALGNAAALGFGQLQQDYASAVPKHYVPMTGPN